MWSIQTSLFYLSIGNQRTTKWCYVMMLMLCSVVASHLWNKHDMAIVKQTKWGNRLNAFNFCFFFEWHLLIRLSTGTSVLWRDTRKLWVCQIVTQVCQCEQVTYQNHCWRTVSAMHEKTNFVKLWYHLAVF